MTDTTNISQEVDSFSKVEVTIQRFLSVPRERWIDTVWYAECTDSQAAKAFFTGIKNSTIHRFTVCKMVADVFMALRGISSDEVISRPKDLKKVQSNAKRLSESLPAYRHLPSPAQSPAFQEGLMSLCSIETSKANVNSSSGNPQRREATLSLARAFSDAFNDIPVDYIHSLISLCWPETSTSTTWRVLSSAVRTAIKAEAAASKEQEIKESQARIGAEQMLWRLSRQKQPMSESQVMHIASLKDQLARLNEGRRLFPSDTVAIRTLLQTAEHLQEVGLSSEMMSAIRAVARDHGIED